MKSLNCSEQFSKYEIFVKLQREVELTKGERTVYSKIVKSSNKTILAFLNNVSSSSDVKHNVMVNLFRKGMINFNRV